MKSDINLVFPNSAEAIKEERIIDLLRMSAIVSVSLTGLFSVVLFLIISQVSPASIKEKEQAALRGILELRPREARLVLVNTKLEDVEKIIEKRQKYEQVMEDIVGAIPPDTSINSLDIDSKKVSLTATSTSLLPLDALIDNLIKMVKDRKIINSFTIENFTTDSKNGIYSVSIVAQRL